ncbi:TPR protein [Fusarium beomiforme]|uniref:TPR protein n=1 Tax=Fusarium beomiforme TaxID=44412 RepID=A0A9P5AC05_9HYPO|nr:TPR protein [Fusarium beomiforme]
MVLGAFRKVVRRCSVKGKTRSGSNEKSTEQRILAKQDMEYLFNMPSWQDPIANWIWSEKWHQKWLAGGPAADLLVSFLLAKRAFDLPPTSTMWDIEFALSFADRLSDIYNEARTNHYESLAHFHINWILVRFTLSVGFTILPEDSDSTQVSERITYENAASYDLARILATFSRVKRTMYELHDDLENIDSALRFAQRAIDLVADKANSNAQPPYVKAYCSAKMSQAIALQTKFTRSHDVNDITEACTILDALHDMTSSGEASLDFVPNVMTLASCHFSHWEAENETNIVELEEIITLWKEALNYMVPHHRLKPRALVGLGKAFSAKARCASQDEQDTWVIKAQHVLDAAYRLSSPYTEDMIETLESLIDILEFRLTRPLAPSKLLELLNQAIQHSAELFRTLEAAMNENISHQRRWVRSAIRWYSFLHWRIKERHDEETQILIRELQREMQNFVDLQIFNTQTLNSIELGEIIQIFSLENLQRFPQAQTNCNDNIHDHSSTFPRRHVRRAYRVARAFGERKSCLEKRRGRVPRQIRKPKSKEGVQIRLTPSERRRISRFEAHISHAESARDQKSLDDAAIRAVRNFGKSFRKSNPLGNPKFYLWGKCLVALSAVLMNMILAQGPLWTSSAVWSKIMNLMKESGAQDRVWVEVFRILYSKFSEAYNRTNEAVLLDLAILACRETAQRSEALANQAESRLNLANLLSQRGYRFSCQEDLDDGIQIVKRLVWEHYKLTTPGWHDFWINAMTLLVQILAVRHDLLGMLADLMDAVKYLGEASLRLTSNDPGWAQILVMLARRLRSLAMTMIKERNTNEVWQASLVVLYFALQAPRIQPWYDREAVHTLALLFEQYSPKRPVESINKSVFLYRKILAMTNSGDPLYDFTTSDLARVLHKRYEADHIANVNDLDEEIGLRQELLNHTPPEDWMWSQLAMDLAKALLSRREHRADASLDQILQLTQQAVERAHSHLCIPPARLYADVLILHGDLKAAYDCLSRALESLASLSPRWLSLTDRQRLLREAQGIQSTVACIGISIDDSTSSVLRVVELLEQSRTLILNSILDFEVEMVELQSAHPKLYTEFIRLRDLLTVKPTTSFQGTDLQINAQQLDWRERQDADRKLQDVVDQIRHIDSKFQGFLRKPSAEQLQQKLNDNETVVIVLNSGVINMSFAIIITKRMSKLVKLVNLKSGDIADKANKLRKVYKMRSIDSRKASKKLKPILEWLWDAAVNDILRVVAPTSGNSLNSTARRSHVCWIPIGASSRFPFHAAMAGENLFAMDMVVSSYAPSLRTIAIARSRSFAPINSTLANVLAITMEETLPGQKSVFEKLSGVNDEAAALRSMFTKVTVLDHPNAAKVLEEMVGKDIVHFACHGESDSRDPSQSHLVLDKGLGRLDFLTAGAVMERRLGQSGIAFLRACSSAQNIVIDLADEVIHLASCFQLAGFTHVLGTMWETDNEACGHVTAKFYHNLVSCDNNGDENPHQKVATAFHDAIVDWMNQPDIRLTTALWVPFIHFGT